MTPVESNLLRTAAEFIGSCPQTVTTMVHEVEP
jgi:hypothetical protein